MDRKGIILLVAALGMFGYYMHEQSKYEMAVAKYKQEQQAADAAAQEKAKAEHPEVAAAPEASSQPGQPAPNAAPSTPAAPVTPDVPEKLETISTPLVEYSFTNLGGGISKAVLLKHIVGLGSDHRGNGDANAKITLNSYGTLPIGAVVEQPGVDANAPFTATVNAQTGEATFERTDARQLQITKKFQAPATPDARGEYVVGLDVTFTNRSDKPMDLPGYFVHTGSAGPIHRLDQSYYTGFDWYNGSNTFRGVAQFTSGGFLFFGRSDQPTFTLSTDNIAWAAVTNQYFCTIVTPAKTKGVNLWARKFTISSLDGIPTPTSGSSQLLAVDGALGMPGLKLTPGQAASQHFDIFTGPREYSRLEKLGADQEQIMDFGFVKLVSKGLLNMMNWLHSLFHSYAAAIVVLTLIVRSFLWPLQNKSTESMKKMQALTPRMNELKAKYPDDPQRMNQELMKLYKDYGVNPLQGCVPMVIQIPIFWGLFRMLPKAVELRNSHFLWIHDLSQPDTVAMIMGFPLNILPLLMAGTMLVQMRLSPKSGDAAQQQMLTFMPLIFVFFCYNYASALALYWTVQNVFSIVQLYVTRNKTTPVLQKLAGAGKKKKLRP